MLRSVIIGLIGDLEGDRDWAVSVLRTLGERGDVNVACQLGDLRFGMGPDPEGDLAAIESVCAEFGLRLLCVNGNHENWARLDQLWDEPRWQDENGSHNPIDVSDHVTLLPRAHRWEMGGRSFVALGGAPSVNRLRLTEGIDWWPSEVIQEKHVETTIARGHAVVMLTHDSPGPPYCTEPIANVIQGNPWGWPDSILAYAQEGIDKVTRAVVGVKPLLACSRPLPCRWSGRRPVPGLHTRDDDLVLGREPGPGQRPIAGPRHAHRRDSGGQPITRCLTLSNPREATGARPKRLPQLIGS